MIRYERIGPSNIIIQVKMNLISGMHHLLVRD